MILNKNYIIIIIFTIVISFLLLIKYKTENNNKNDENINKYDEKNESEMDMILNKDRIDEELNDLLKEYIKPLSFSENINIIKYEVKQKGLINGVRYGIKKIKYYKKKRKIQEVKINYYREKLKYYKKKTISINERNYRKVLKKRIKFEKKCDLITNKTILNSYSNQYGNMGIYCKYWINTCSENLLIICNGFSSNILQIPIHLIKDLTENNSLVIWDYPGVGLSTGLLRSDGSSGLNFINAAECINTIALNFRNSYSNISNIYTIGHSWGGIVAQEALKYELINGAIAISSGCTSCKNLPGIKNFENVVKCNSNDKFMGKTKDLMFFNDKSEITRNSVNNIYKKINDNSHSKYLNPLFPSNVFDAQINSYNKMNQTDRNIGSCVTAKKSMKPVFLIHGINDCVIDSKLSKFANKFNPNSYIKIVNRCGHGCIFHKPKLIFKYIKDALFKFKYHVSKDPSNYGSKFTCPRNESLNITGCPHNNQYFKECVNMYNVL